MTSDALLQAAATIYGVMPDITYEKAVDAAFALRDLIDQRLREEKGIAPRNATLRPHPCICVASTGDTTQCRSCYPNGEYRVF